MSRQRQRTSDEGVLSPKAKADFEVNIHQKFEAERATSTKTANSSSDVLSFIPDLQERRKATSPRGGVTHSVRGAGELSLMADSHYATVFLHPVAGVLTTTGGDSFREIDVPAGAVGVLPAGMEAKTVWRASRETVSIVIPPGKLAALAEQECRGLNAEMIFKPAVTTDRWAIQVAHMFRDELENPAGINELYIDSLITMFGIHLLRKYSSAAAVRISEGAKLSKVNESRLREFLAVNFTQKLSVADLAEQCGLSQGHFIVAFTSTFGERPHQYLIKRRLDFAQHLLIHSDKQISEIALLSGFSSQSHLTAAMKRDRGLTPKQVRSQGSVFTRTGERW